mmetsp:Transcript_44664/g.54062  ORF Transcript_44664/g.54062 Transcript_44664/m.54062 type:complete len:187 (-) Transcript_44664:194-754(-)
MGYHPWDATKTSQNIPEVLVKNQSNELFHQIETKMRTKVKKCLMSIFGVSKINASRLNKTRATGLLETNMDAIQMTKAFVNGIEDDGSKCAAANSVLAGCLRNDEETSSERIDAIFSRSAGMDELPPLFRDGNFVMVDGMILLKEANKEEKRFSFFGTRSLRSVFRENKRKGEKKNCRIPYNLKER